MKSFSQFIDKEVLNEYVLLGNPEAQPVMAVYGYLAYFSNRSHLIIAPESGGSITITLKPSVYKEITTTMASLCQMMTDKYGHHLIDDQLGDHFANRNAEEIFDFKSEDISDTELNQIAKFATTKSLMRGLYVYQKASNSYRLEPTEVLKKLDSGFSDELSKLKIHSPLNVKFFKIDNKNKTLSPYNRELDHRSRIGKLSSSGKISKATYAIPAVDHSTDFRTARQICIALIKKDPKYKLYTFVEFMTTGQDRSISVMDFIKGNDPETGQVFKSVEAVKSNSTSKPIIAYHGTSMGVWRKIVKSGGLVPGLGGDYHDKIKGHSEHNVYLSTDITEARKYAVRASGLSEAVVIEVQVPDNTKITFDEDTINRVSGKVKGLLIKKHGEIDFATYLKDKGLYNYNMDGYGIFYRQWLELAQKDAKIAEDPVVKDMLRLFPLLAVQKSGELFAYKGKIPLRYLKIKESFNSERVAEDDYQSDIPTRVRNSIKRH